MHERDSSLDLTDQNQTGVTFVRPVRVRVGVAWVRPAGVARSAAVEQEADGDGGAGAE